MTNPFESLEQKLERIENLLTEYLPVKPKQISQTQKSDIGLEKIPIQDIFDRRVLSKPTFYKYVKEGKITLYKLGGRSYIDINQFNQVFHKVNLSV